MDSIKTIPPKTKNNNNSDRSNDSFWGNFICIILIIVIIIGIIMGNFIVIVTPITIIILFILFGSITASSVKTVKPDNFLAMTDDYSRHEINYVKSAKEMIDECDDNRLLIFLKGLITYYAHDKSDDSANLTLSSDLNEQQAEAYKKLVEAFKAMSHCDMIWYIDSKPNELSNFSISDKVERKKTAFAFSGFNHVFTNLTKEVPMMRDLHYSYYIYPEFIVKAITPIEFELIPIENISINFKSLRFKESSFDWKWPKDGLVVDHTYQYVNKNGTPDKRYASNKLVPVYFYGNFMINKLDLNYLISKHDVTEQFVIAFKEYQKILKPQGNELDTETNEQPQTLNIVDIPNDKPAGNIFGISPDYYENVIKPVRLLTNFYHKLETDYTIMETIGRSLPNPLGDNKRKFLILAFKDLIKNYQRMGYEISDLKTREGFALVLLHSFLNINMENIEHFQFEHIYMLTDMEEVTERVFHAIKTSSILIDYPDDNFFYISKILTYCNRKDLVVSYFNALYRLFSIMAKADNIINETEKNWLKKLASFCKEQKQDKKNDFAVSNKLLIKDETIETSIEPSNEIKDPIEELNKLIGLSNVKTEVNNLSNLVKIQKMRESRGMKTSKVSYHCIFTGNPGTGKTTVARIVAEIYKQLGVLKKGHLVETDRSGLVAEYVGQTAPKTNAIIDSALDGVLFIDEAYSLVQGGQNDYGKEAISTLLKRMEDDRDRFVVILAGYSKEMEDFINSNSGLQSRFNRYIDFSDYSCDELMEIFEYILKNNDCVASEKVLSCVKKHITQAMEKKDKNFGNARFVRNLFEKIITQQANRLATEPKITNEMLSEIEEIDVERAL